MAKRSHQARWVCWRLGPLGEATSLRALMVATATPAMHYFELMSTLQPM
jgi:hypothetical protein